VSIVSLRSKKRLLEISSTALICLTAYFMQMLVLNYLGIHGIISSLPLTVVIVWGLVFGSNLPQLSSTDLRRRSLSEIFTRQLASGSHSGFLVGWLFSMLFWPILPVYPVCFPLIGWLSGYFCLRGISQGNLLSIPLTFILTILAEAIMAWELIMFAGPVDVTHPLRMLSGDWCKTVLDHLAVIMLPEALLNSIIAPFLYFPMRRWYDMVEGQQSSFPID
jgi:rod shape-determining protein MreD